MKLRMLSLFFLTAVLAAQQTMGPNGVKWQPIAPLIVGYKLKDQAALWIREDGRIVLARMNPKDGSLMRETTAETNIQCDKRNGYDFTWRNCLVLPEPKCAPAPTTGTAKHR